MQKMKKNKMRQSFCNAGADEKPVIFLIGLIQKSHFNYEYITVKYNAWFSLRRKRKHKQAEPLM